MYAFSFSLSLIVKDIYAFPLCLLIQLIPDPSDLFLIQLWVRGPDNAVV